MKNYLSKTVSAVVALFALTIFAATAARAQALRPDPELCAADFCIGESEDAIKIKLQDYSPRYDNPLHQPKYFFYNEYGNQVMSLTAYSKERPFLLVGIEVFGVDDSYTTKHHQMKNTAAFTTESGFFIGLRPSATSMIFGVPNAVGPKEVAKKKGQPDTDEKPDKVRVFRYKLGDVKKLDAQNANMRNVKFGAYTAEYRFYKNRLRHIILAVDTNA